jgi:hypothetical protein
MSLEGASQPQCFLIKPSRQANSVIIKTIDQKTNVRTQKSSNSPGKCYKPISYSIDIQCCIIGNRLLLAKRVICLSLRGGRDMHHFYWIGLDIPTFSVFTNVIDTFHTVDTIGLCLPFERDCYLSRTVAYVG